MHLRHSLILFQDLSGSCEVLWCVLLYCLAARHDAANSCGSTDEPRLEGAAAVVARQHIRHRNRPGNYQSSERLRRVDICNEQIKRAVTRKSST